MSYIKKIRIKNFKNLEDVEIDLKPLTFLFGPNGSGKSSFMKALLFFYKNVFPVNHLNTQYKISDDLDLGSFDDCVTNGDRKRNIEFEFTIDFKNRFPDKRIFDIEKNQDFLESKESESFYIKDLKGMINSLNSNFFEEYSRIMNSGDPYYIGSVDEYNSEYNSTFILKFIFKYNKSGKNLFLICIMDKSNGNLIEYNINYSAFTKINFNDQNKYINCFLENRFQYNIFGKPDFPYFNKNDFIEGNDFIEKGLDPISDNRERYKQILKNWLKLGVEKRREIYYEFIKFTYTAIAVIPQYLKFSLDYLHLPIIREIPKPKYLLINKKFNFKDYYGFLDLLYPERKKKIKSKDLTIFDKINLSLNQMGFDKKINLYTNNDVGYIYFQNKNKKKINLANESSGLIQVLPIIISMSVEPKIPLIMIEQPELHLHPKLQSKLADVLLKAVYGDDTRNTVLVETHSEHLIRKIQILIAKGELEREKAAVYYFNNAEGSTQIKEMEIEENGFFKVPWPDGFFDDTANLSWELLTAKKN